MRIYFKSVLFVFLWVIVGLAQFEVDSIWYDAGDNTMVFRFNRTVNSVDETVNLNQILLASDDTLNTYILNPANIDRIGGRDICFYLNSEDALYIEQNYNFSQVKIKINEGAFTRYTGEENEPISFLDNFIINYIIDEIPPELTDIYYDFENDNISMIFNESIDNTSFNTGNSISFGGINLDIIDIIATDTNKRITIELNVGTIDLLDDLSDFQNIEIFIEAGTFGNYDQTFNEEMYFSEGGEVKVGWGKYFWMKDLKKFSSGYTQKFATLRQVTGIAEYYILLDDWRNNFIQNDLDTLTQYFETSLPESPLGEPYTSNGIYYMVRDIFGHESDVDENDKITFVIGDISDNYIVGGNDTNDDLYFPGYVSNLDLNSENEFSNNGDILYIDCYPQQFAEESEEYLQSGIQGVAEVFQKLVAINVNAGEEQWVIDGFSNLAQFFTGKEYASFYKDKGMRVTHYMPYSLTSSIPNYIDKYRLCKNNQYLFFLYLFEKQGELNTIKNIALDDNIGVSGIQEHISVDFKEMFNDFSIACNLDTIGHPEYGNNFGFENLELDGVPSLNYPSFIEYYNNSDSLEKNYTIPGFSYKGIIISHFQDIADFQSMFLKSASDSYLNFQFIGVNEDLYHFDGVFEDFYFLQSPLDSTYYQSLPIDFNSELIFGEDYNHLIMIVTNLQDVERKFSLANYDIAGIPKPTNLNAYRFHPEKINIRWNSPFYKKMNGKNKTKREMYNKVKNNNYIFNLYRSLTENGIYELIADSLIECNYNDANVSPDSSYFYKIKSISINPSGMSDFTEAVFVDIYTPTGNLWQTASNYGRQGEPDAPDNGLPSMEWPAGSGINYLWHGGLCVGGIVDDGIHVTIADYNGYEFGGSMNEFNFYVMGDSIFDITTTYTDINDRHSTAPLNLQVVERIRTWPAEEDSLLSNIILYEYKITNIGEDVINDTYTGWVWDCDVGCVADPSDPHIDDLVDFEGEDGEDTQTDELDIVENYDWNENGKLDGYDEWGIPYGYEKYSGLNTINPNFDPSKIHPDGYPDEYQVVVGDETETVSRNTSYMYDADDPVTGTDDTGERNEVFGPVDGFIGMRLLKSPNGIHAHQYWNWKETPENDAEMYQYLSGTHEFSNGNKFMPNPLESGYNTFDYRFLLSAGMTDELAPGDTLYYTVAATVGKGLRGMRENLDYIYLKYDSLESFPTGIEVVNENLAKKFSLKQNYPNPFNPSTKLKFQLPVRSKITLTVYNVLGQQVKILADDYLNVGTHIIDWSGMDHTGNSVATGVYFFELKIEGKHPKKFITKGLLLK